MPFKDLLLHLDSYPDPTSAPAVDEAIAFARAVGGGLTALAYEIVVPLESNRLADWVVDLSGLIRDAEQRSREACRTGVDRFKRDLAAAGLTGETIVTRADLFDVADDVARRARTRDLCLIPLGGRTSGHLDVAQSAIFESGRPVLVYRPGEDAFAKGLKTICVAWDGGRAAARALAEALPILAQADEVRLLTIVGEKPSARPGLATDAQRHLVRHGISAAIDEVDPRGQRIGAALDGYLADIKPDLLVMGAYGAHSRLREFVLGGATEHVLTAGKVPALLAH